MSLHFSCAENHKRHPASCPEVREWSFYMGSEVTWYKIKPWSYTGTRHYSMGKASGISSSEKEKNTSKFSHKIYRKMLSGFPVFWKYLNYLKPPSAYALEKEIMRKDKDLYHFGSITLNFYKPFFHHNIFSNFPLSSLSIKMWRAHNLLIFPL